MAIALVLGATGLVGRALTELLLQDTYWEEVHVFVRRTTGITNSRLHEHIINFDEPQQWEQLVKGDVLFSALGTTLATAGSKAAQYKVDFTYQYQFAAAAAQNGVKKFMLVSSANATAKSMIFYSRMKGELDAAVMKLPFSFTGIVRPGMLAGEREENRTGERIALKIVQVLQHIPGLNMLKPIPGATVAKALIFAAKNQVEPRMIYEMPKLFTMADRYSS